MTIHQVAYRVINLNTARSVFQSFYDKIDRETNVLHSQLTDLFQGHITASILPPELLRKTLREIKYRMPPGLSLPYDPESDLYKYYRLFHAHVQPSSYGFLVTATLPIFDAISTFIVYSITHIPIFLQVQNSYINSTAHYITKHQYVAFSEDVTKIIFLDPKAIDFCLHEELHFCFISQPIYEVPLLTHDCIVSLFFNFSHTIDVCRTQLATTSLEHPIATAISPNLWAITTAQPCVFTLLCPNGSYPVTLAPPMAILRLPSGCSAKSNLLTLPNQIPINTDITLPQPDIDVTSLHTIWQPFHESLSSTRYHKLPQKLPELILPHVSVQALSSALAPVKTIKHGMHWYIIALIVLVIMITILWGSSLAR